MSPFVIRVAAGFLGAVVVALIFYWIGTRRRRREMEDREASQAAASDAPAKQPGWMQSVFTSIVAPIISGIVLFLITSYFISDKRSPVDFPEPLPVFTQTDPAEPAINLPPPEDGLQEPELPDAALIEETEPKEEPELPEPIADDLVIDEPSGLEVVIDVPDLDVSISDGTAEWGVSLSGPESFDGAVPANGKLLIEGASVTVPIELSPARALTLLEIPAPRIQLDGASVSEVLFLSSPLLDELPMDLRVLIQDAATVTTLNTLGPPPVESPSAPRVLIEGAVITELLKLIEPEMESEDDDAL